VIVLDASVVVELLTNGAVADSLRRGLAARDDSFIAPHLLDIEVVSAIRSLIAGRRIDSYRSEPLLHGPRGSPRRALCAPAFARPHLGIASQLHGL
jgi:hypothetical protein